MPKPYILARVLGIDFGRKKTGIAVTDDLQLIASGLTTVKTQSLLAFLKSYVETENVEAFVVGEPKKLNGTPSEIEPEIQAFIKKLRIDFPRIPVLRVDERYTSKMAFQTLIDSGLKKMKRRNKELIDEVSATLILQTYLAGRGKRDSNLFN